eukprot:8919330-Lingulodinium_polyedra.AAC.1
MEDCFPRGLKEGVLEISFDRGMVGVGSWRGRAAATNRLPLRLRQGSKHILRRSLRLCGVRA